MAVKSSVLLEELNKKIEDFEDSLVVLEVKREDIDDVLLGEIEIKVVNSYIDTIKEVLEKYGIQCKHLKGSYKVVVLDEKKHKEIRDQEYTLYFFVPHDQIEIDEKEHGRFRISRSEGGVIIECIIKTYRHFIDDGIIHLIVTKRLLEELKEILKVEKVRPFFRKFFYPV